MQRIAQHATKIGRTMQRNRKCMQHYDSSSMMPTSVLFPSPSFSFIPSSNSYSSVSSSVIAQSFTRQFHSTHISYSSVVTPPVSSSPAVEVSDFLIHQYSDRPARPVSLSTMVLVGEKATAAQQSAQSNATLLASAQWLATEMPVRLAKRLRDLEDLPFGLSQSTEVKALVTLYKQSFAESINCTPPIDGASELLFTELLKKILARHQKVLVDLASGVTGGFLRSQTVSTRPRNQHFLLQEFLDRFNLARIGLRLLMAQHVALHTPRPNMVGVIEIGCNPTAVVEQASSAADRACRSAYGIAPKVIIQDTAAKKGGIKGFNYVSAHLRAMCFQLLMNSMKATVEHAIRKQQISQGWKPTTVASTSASSSTSTSTSTLPSSVAATPSTPIPNPPPVVDMKSLELPAIQVVLVDTPTDITIKISDRGGGISRAELPLVFTYTYSAKVSSAKANAAATTSPPASTPPASSPSASPSSSSSSSASPDWMNGENFQPVLNTCTGSHHDFVDPAFGLPITRLYARYTGGDLQLFSLPNHGTDSYLFINRVGDFQEVIQD